MLKANGLKIRLRLLAAPGAESGFEDYPAEVQRCHRKLQLIQLD